ncbi:MAG: hypothetical protein ACI4EU_01155 [Butyrivibrio sp.]
MKKNMTKIVSCVLVCAMAIGCCGMVLASPQEVSVNAGQNTRIVKEEDNTEKPDISNVIDNTDVDKEETVYVITKADGTVDKVIVSELLKNPDKKNKLEDVTLLSDIVNVKSDAGYVINGSSCVWDAAGENICYRGTTSQEIPVTFKISFKLDGKNVSAEDMDGASGDMEMTFTYMNNLKKDATIDGKTEKINVPFVMMSGMIFSNDSVKHISVDNGKIIDDGDKSIVVGFALPGLAENLDVDNTDIPSEFTIKASVSDFEMPTVVTAATNDIFNKIDIDDNDALSDIEDKLALLDSSMKQIADGSSELYGYLTQLLSKSSELVDGVQTLTGYAEKISGSLDKLYNDGILTVDGKLKELSDGLDTISGNSAQLNGGARQVYDTLIATVQTQMAQAGLDQLGIQIPVLTVDNYQAELDKLVSELDESAVRQKAQMMANGQVTAEVEKNTDKITSAVTEAVKTQVVSSVTSKVKENVTATVTAKVREMVTVSVTEAVKAQVGEAAMESDNVKALISQNIEAKMAGDEIRALIAQTINEQMDSDEINAVIGQNVNEQMDSDAIKATISQNVAAQKSKLIDENMSGEQVQAQIEAAVGKAKAGAEAIKSAKASLDSYNTFYQGVLQYTAGVDMSAAGGRQLSAAYSENITANMKELNDKLKEYVNGMQNLNGQVPALKDAVSQITDGAKELSDGSSEFYNSGIKGIIEKADDVMPVIERLKATIDVSGEYQSFGGISDDMTGNVKFIYRTN